MITYIVKRLALIPFVLLGVTVLVFVLIRIVPGDIVDILLADSGFATPERVAELEQELGLDRSIPEQYGIWLGNVVTGDLGTSLVTGSSVASAMADALEPTIELTVLTLILGTIVGVPAGIISAIRQDAWADYVTRSVTIAGLSIPSFWLGTLFFVLPFIWWGWAPPFVYESFWDDPRANLEIMLPPAIALASHFAAIVMRMTRSSLLDVLRQDYIRTAWAKGLNERRVVLGHALKNALIPVLTVIGNQFSYLLGGTVIMETLFAIPGFGRLTVDAIAQRDYVQIQASVLFIGFAIVLINLAVDLLYAWLDPRIRYA